MAQIVIAVYKDIPCGTQIWQFVVSSLNCEYYHKSQTLHLYAPYLH